MSLYNPLLKYLASFGLSFFIVLLCTPLLIKFAPFTGLMDDPEKKRHIHDKAVPLGGGIVIFLAFHSSCFLFYSYLWPEYSGLLDSGWWHAFLISSALLLLVGIVDDLFEVSPWLKLLGQAGACTTLYLIYGRDLDVFGSGTPVYIDLVFILIWSFIIINSFNLIDGLDGLCSGLALISSLGLAAVYILNTHPGNAVICLALAGACLAFLRFNFHPARVFLGDSGSMFLGFALASISLYAGGKSTFFVTLATPFFIAGIPIIDTLLAIWRRSIRKALPGSRKSVKVMSGDREHLHHRLMDMGLKQHHVALLLYGVNIVIVLTGLTYIIAVKISTGLFMIFFMITMYILIKHVIQIELWETSKLLAHHYRNNHLLRYKIILFPLFDLAWMSMAFWLSAYIVLNGTSPFVSMGDWARALPFWLLPTFILLFITKTYQKSWRSSFFRDYLFLALSILSGSVLNLTIASFTDFGLDFFIVNQMMIFCLLSLLGIIGLRIPFHFIREWGISAKNPSPGALPPRNILLYGAGPRGGLYLRERYLLHSDEIGRMNIIGFIDDSESLREQYLYGKQVLGSLKDLEDLVLKNNINDVIVTTFISDENHQYLQDIARTLGFSVYTWGTYTKNVVC